MNEAALLALFQDHRAGLAGAVRSVLGNAADHAEVLQEAFTRALVAARAGRIRADPVGFVFVVAMNCARDVRRRADRRSRDRSDEDPMELPSPDAPPDARMQRDELVARARLAIARLDDPEKEVFVLRVSGGLSFEAVADSLSIPLGTAKTRMRAALSRLRRELGAAPFGPDLGDAS
jgi:RNA polymerase sigma factor (sigma-70 family)